MHEIWVGQPEDAMDQNSWLGIFFGYLNTDELIVLPALGMTRLVEELWPDNHELEFEYQAAETLLDALCSTNGLEFFNFLKVTTRTWTFSHACGSCANVPAFQSPVEESSDPYLTMQLGQV